MKKNLIIAIAFIVSAGLFTACSTGGTKDQSTKSSSVTGEKIVYTCTMDPEVISDKPGKCPKCGMDLVEKVIRTDTSAVKKADTAR